jgi:hypothetical protein
MFVFLSSDNLSLLNRIEEQVQANEKLLLEIKKELKSLRTDLNSLLPEVTVRRADPSDAAGYKAAPRESGSNERG